MRRLLGWLGAAFGGIALYRALTRVLKITDGVMRHMAVRRIEGSSTAAPPLAAVGGREYADANERSVEEEEE